MLNANAGNSGKTQLLGRLDANHPIQDGIAAPDQHGIAKAELGDRGCDFTTLSRFLTPHVRAGPMRSARESSSILKGGRRSLRRRRGGAEANDERRSRRRLPWAFRSARKADD